MLGLRSLFFLLRSLLDQLHYLKPALAVVLGFVGLKMLAEPWVSVPVWLSLAVIGGVLLVAFVASWWRARRLPASPEGDDPGA